ncbi:AAA family ATPase [Devosia nitrariae]|uniref:AAA+ ATPase domain-containing protein n=1 Tax=Devosia nitrariae TaxID=2071872 RepID=A0ABQ5W121_9HYPH|nr:AAA family ATPase [Devosia nitrariae]GLQ53571.1 hypothetical protein GCM10010862_08300 [Devosia nitrariae]
MSGNASSRSDSASIFTDTDRAALKHRLLRREQILDGALPSNKELLTGLPLRCDDLQSDVMAYIDGWKAKADGRWEQDVIVAAELARADASIENLSKLYEALEPGSYDEHELSDRVQIWLAYWGDRDALTRVCVLAATPNRRLRDEASTDAYRLTFSIGITTRKHIEEYKPGAADQVMLNGMKHLSKLTAYIDALRETVEIEGDAAKPTSLARLIARFSAAVDEGEQESVKKLDALLGEDLDEDDVVGLVVVPSMPAVEPTGKASARDIRHEWEGLAGKAFPLVQRGDIAQQRRQLVAAWPHASEIIDVILSDLAASEIVRFRPTLIVGEPGSGKSSLARAILETVGLPSQLVPMAGASDSSLMGTSAQWSTARESIPLQLIKNSRTASVGMIWDEIEKASDSRHNGSAVEALLPMLEIDQARRYRDLALELEVDLSAVTHFATANSAEGIPAPIRDRMRILQMPEPGWQHLGTLTRQIIDRIAGERGVDPRFFGSLAEDELELVRRAWPGGSIRKLTRIVATIIAGRDRILGRC